MLWKVYSKCCVAVPAVKVVYDDALQDAIYENVEHELDTMEIDDSSDDSVNQLYENLYTKYYDSFKCYGYIDAGDYRIVESDEMPDRPNCCGYMTILSN